MRRIAVIDYDPAWPDRFEAEARELRAIWGEAVRHVHHIGSTAIVGMPAKPIVDLLVVLSRLDVVDASRDLLRQRGYLPMGEFGVPGRRFVIKGTEEHRTHHIHAFAEGHPRIRSYLDFRDYLRTHADQALEYGRLKRQMAACYPHDPEAYMAGKETLIRQINQRAAAWRCRRDNGTAAGV